MTKSNSSDQLLSRLFFNMLPVQILIFAMGSINSLVDGTMAGRFIGASAVGVIGLYYSMVEIMSASGSVLLGGTAVLCGRFMGRGELDKTSGIFSLNMTVTFIIGTILTFISLVLPGPLATLLGANELLMDDLKIYIVGYGIGILPMLFAQQLAAFLQMERQSVRGYVGIAGMIITNVASDILFVSILRMGIWGLALATSLSNLVYFLILIPYYFTKKARRNCRALLFTLLLFILNVVGGDAGIFRYLRVRSGLRSPRFPSDVQFEAASTGQGVSGFQGTPTRGAAPILPIVG